MGVEAVHFDRTGLEPVVELVVAGNSAQMADPAFRAELKTLATF